jgi:glycosidase
MSEIRDVEAINRYNENIEIGRKSQEIFAEILAGGRDNARTPICWDDSENAGFTTGVPWIRVNGDYKECNAKIQLEDSTSTFNYFKSLMALRKANKSTLVYGDFKPIETNDKTFCLYRESKEGKFYIEMNLTDNIIERPISAEGECVLSNYSGTADTLRAYEVNIYRVKK